MPTYIKCVGMSGFLPHFPHFSIFVANRGPNFPHMSVIPAAFVTESATFTKHAYRSITSVMFMLGSGPTNSCLTSKSSFSSMTAFGAANYIKAIRTK